MLKFIGLIYFIVSFSAIQAQIPAPVGMVNDYEGILNEAQEKELDSIIRAYKKKTKREIAIVTKASVSPYIQVSEFCLDLFESWGIGHERNTGLLLFVSTTLGEVHITTGTITKKKLSVDICMEIIREKIIPHLKKGEYFEGIKNGLLELIRKWGK